MRRRCWSSHVAFRQRELEPHAARPRRSHAACAPASPRGWRCPGDRSVGAFRHVAGRCLEAHPRLGARRLGAAHGARPRASIGVRRPWPHPGSELDRGAAERVGAPARRARRRAGETPGAAEQRAMTNDSPPHVVIERVLPGSPEEVYAAWTTPETLRLFMCPGDMTAPIVEAAGPVGGRFRIVMRDGTRDSEHRGGYRVLEPGRRLVFTWASASTGWAETLVTIELSPHEDGT